MRTIIISALLLCACSNSSGADRGEQPMGVGEPQRPRYVRESIETLEQVIAEPTPCGYAAAAYVGWACEDVMSGFTNEQAWWVWVDFHEGDSFQVDCPATLENIQEAARGCDAEEVPDDVATCAGEAFTEHDFACCFWDTPWLNGINHGGLVCP